MKTIKILGFLLAAAFMFTTGSAYADYTVELKNESGTIIKSYNITTNQVAHLQKKASRDEVSVIKQFENAIISLIFNAKIENKMHWQRDNDIYIEEQSRQ
ncbi:hypothetical protein KAR91_27845 [Candidatus Pacearchaeota archaeon]|nr:hypothetical protein [Candidatus Pacearchaeota archaeon]